jgi:CubicO group peptidase (beta-lactamase class C family)
MKVLAKVLKVFSAVLILIILAANLFIVLSGRFYLYKGLANTYFKGRSGPSIYDKDVFYFTTLKKSENVFYWKKGGKQIQLKQKNENFIKSLGGRSFLVFKNDTLIFEKYWEEHSNKTVSNSFSATKTFVSLLIGIALDEAYIKSLDEPVGNYLNEFKENDKKNITIRHLLMMSSGLNWEESAKNPLSENAASYYGGNLKQLVLNQKGIEKPGVRFSYQSGNSQLLGFIIEIATKKDLSAYAEEKIWSKIGTENDAYWTLDKENGDEKAFCCLYGTSRDFARLGKLILQKGRWNNEQIIPESYMDEIFKNPKMKTDENIENYRYGLHLWTYLGNKNPVYYCRGILGQYIITIPKENIIIVRTGFERMKNIEKSKNKYKIGHPADLFRYLSIANDIVKQMNN